MTASLLLKASLLLCLSVVAACEARGAVQPPPTNCTTAANCMLGTDASGKWLKQTLPSGTQGPPGPTGATGATGPAGPQGIAGAAGVNGGPLTSKTYVGGNAIVPNLWYAIDKSISSNVAVVLPPAGVAPWTNPALSCWTNYGTGQTTFTSTSPLYGAPVFLGQNQTVCFGVDDLSPAGWRGDGGN